MSFKPYWIIPGEKNPDGTDKHCKNAQAFATKEEALASAHARFMVWTLPSDCGADESDQPVNYRRDSERGDVYLEKPNDQTRTENTGPRNGPNEAEAGASQR